MDGDLLDQCLKLIKREDAASIIDYPIFVLGKSSNMLNEEVSPRNLIRDNEAVSKTTLYQNK